METRPSGMKLEKPGPDDIRALAQLYVLARRLVRDATWTELADDASDLALAQTVVDAGRLEFEDEWRALGLVFGRALVSAIPGFEWAVIEDAWGRDCVLRFEQTSLVVNVLEMLLKRAEEGQHVDLRELFEDTAEAVNKVIAEQGLFNRPN